MGKSAPFFSKYGTSQKESKERVMSKEIKPGNQVSKNISMPKKITKTKIKKLKLKNQEKNLNKRIFLMKF